MRDSLLKRLVLSLRCLVIQLPSKFTGYGIEKELVNIAKEEAKQHNKKHLLAVVSKDNVPSYLRLKKADLTSLDSISIYMAQLENLLPLK